MAKKKKTDAPPEDLTRNFETAFAKLEEIVSQLEQGKLTLAESLDRYEEGVHHLKQCYAALNQAEQRIELMVDLDEDGRLITEPLESEGLDTSQASQSPRRRRRKSTSTAKEDPAGNDDGEDGESENVGLF